jgi:IS30 family transposase
MTRYKQESFFLTLADKATKSTIIRKLPNKKAETVVEAFKDIMKTTLYDFKTLTSDNGTEFTEHARICEITGALFFFANPYSSWERGLNEHTNGLIRRFFPKGTDFNTISEDDIAMVEFILNSRGREALGFKSPNDIMLEYLKAA